MEAKTTAVKIDDVDEPPRKPPPPPPPKRLSRPKITLSIPDSPVPRGPVTAKPMTPRQASQLYWGPMKYHGRPPTTPVPHIADPHGNPYFNPFMHMYHNKASDFMFKQFEGFKDFTMNTAKSGLSAGEKSAFWFYNKLRTLSKKWFTHLFLTLCLFLYSVLGAAMFMALEGQQGKGNVTVMNITDIRRDLAIQLEENVKSNPYNALEAIEDVLKEYAANYTECLKQSCEDPKKAPSSSSVWNFWNSMFYAGTIYTTIGMLMNNII